MRHAPVPRALVRNRLRVDQPRETQARDKDLDRLLAAVRPPKPQRLAREVRHAPDARLIVKTHRNPRRRRRRTVCKLLAEMAVAECFQTCFPRRSAILPPQLLPSHRHFPTLPRPGQFRLKLIPVRDQPTARSLRSRFRIPMQRRLQFRIRQTRRVRTHSIPQLPLAAAHGTPCCGSPPETPQPRAATNPYPDRVAKTPV